MTTGRRISWRNERGVSAIIVAVAMIAIFGAAMLSIDAGNLWQTRRGVITATDSAALAEAQALAFSTAPTSCTTTNPPAWQAALLNNTQGFPSVEWTAADEGCTFYPGANGTGYVTVAVRRLSQAKFGNVLGIGDTKAYSLSAAMYGYLQNFKGLRPVGVCVNNSHIREWKALKNVPTAPPENVTYLTRDSDGDGTPDHAEDGFPNDVSGTSGVFDQLDYNALPSTEPGEDTDGDGTLEAVEKDHPNDEYTGASWYPGKPHVVHRIRENRDSSEDGDCGEDPGNWGYQDFNEGANSQSEQADWFLNGYQKNYVGIPGCNPDGSGSGCEGNTGAVGGGGGCDKKATNTPQALQCLVEGQVEFPIVVYDSADCETSGQGGGGSNCRYHIAAMVGVILRGYQVKGNQDERYLDVEFTDIIPTGGCCVVTPSGLDLGANKGVRLCAVDHDPLTLDVRCLAKPA